MNTPPVTPREGNRRHLTRTGGSCHQVLTPAKTDDFSRPSSIRLPKDAVRSPVTSFKQPVIRFDETQLTSPLVKKRKSTTISPRVSVNQQERECISVSQEGGYRTPPHRSVPKDLIYAPRKQRHPSSNNTECDLFEPVRVLDFGQRGDELCKPLEHSPDIDWDSIGDCHCQDSKDVVILRKFVSVVALSGIDTHGECKSSELKALLSIPFSEKEYQRCIKILRQFNDMIFWTEYGAKVRFSNAYSPAEILRRLQNSSE